MSDLYEADIVLWSEHQAELLRQHAATARENDAIDWPNIIAEIESVGNEQRFKVESLLRQACPATSGIDPLTTRGTDPLSFCMPLPACFFVRLTRARFFIPA
jgi:hypothetical protein